MTVGRKLVGKFPLKSDDECYIIQVGVNGAPLTVTSTGCTKPGKRIDHFTKHIRKDLYDGHLGIREMARQYRESPPGTVYTVEYKYLRTVCGDVQSKPVAAAVAEEIAKLRAQGYTIYNDE